MTAPPSVAVLDVDGTLLDSTYLHVEAWTGALAEHGLAVDAWRVHRAIGMGGQELAAALLPDADEATRLRVEEEHATRYAALVDRLRPLDGADRLLEALADRGLRVVLATSAGPDEVERMGEVLPALARLPLVGGGDVERAKPHPDVVAAALERIGARAADAVMAGDSVWDVRAAGRAGVRCVGLRSGGVGAAELVEAGAVEVHDGPAALARDLATSAFGDGSRSGTAA